MTRDPDLIRWVLDWLLANDDAITQDLALRCEREARATWGGCTEYIPKAREAERQARLAAARQAVAAGVPPPKAARQAGVGRSTLYRHLEAAAPAPAGPPAPAQPPQAQAPAQPATARQPAIDGTGRIQLGASRRFSR